MNKFQIKSISLAQKEVRNIEVQKMRVLGMNQDCQYAVAFQYKDAELYFTYSHRNWKGELVEQMGYEIGNKIKEFESEKEIRNEEKQVNRIKFALETKLKMKLGQTKFNKIFHDKTWTQKSNYVLKEIRKYKRKVSYEATLKELYIHCMHALYEKSVKELNKKEKEIA